MFRDIRRIKRKISDEDAKMLLRDGKRAALSVIGDGGYPYTIPINFYYEEDENRIYFHGAKAGHKIDAMKACDKVCFTIWDNGYLDEGDWAYRVSSCVVFGRAVFIDDRALADEKLLKLTYKYFPSEEEAEKEFAKGTDAAQVIAIEIEHLSGKRVHEI